jgi:hypothetical protein
MNYKIVGNVRLHSLIVQNAYVELHVVEAEPRSRGIQNKTVTSIPLAVTTTDKIAYAITLLTIA